MSRLTGSEAKALMEAYEAVYAPQEITEEQIWEEVENWVNSLLEEGYDLSEYTWEEMYEAYLSEAPMTAFQAGGGQAKLDKLNKGLSPRSGLRATPSTIETQGQQNLYKAGGGDAAIARGPSRTQNTRGGGQIKVPTLTRQDIINRGTVAAGTKTPTNPTPPPRQTPPDAPRQTPPAAPRQTPPSVSGPKVKPTQPAAPTKPAGSAMDQWAKANPKLAAAAAEKARIRGTQQTDNPLMKDMKSRLPMNSPSVQSPNVAKLGAGNQSLVNNPNAFKAAPEVKKTAAIAATPKPAPVAPSQNLKQSYEYDAFDLVLEYLIDNGHVETVDEALYVMLEMDAEVINDIVEEVINEDSATLSAAARRRAQEMGAKRRRTPAYKAGGNRGTGRNERAAYNLSNIQRTGAANPDTQRTRSRRPSTEDTGMHQGDYERYNRKDPKKNPKHDENK